MTENDLSAIRSRYLGVDKKKRKIRKMNDRKFVFDWDAQDDTLVEDSFVAVGSNRQGAQVMFGRGHLAGMDDGGPSGPRKSETTVTHLADAMERRKAAKAGFDERHWTEKPLEEMKERDWRIFREDFSISARGNVRPFLGFAQSLPITSRRWPNTSSTPFLDGVCYSTSDSRMHREYRIQGTLSHSTAGDSHRTAEPRYYWYRRDWYVGMFSSIVKL